MKKLLVVVDGSPASVNALKWALNFSNNGEHALKIVTTYDQSILAFGLSALTGLSESQYTIESHKLLAEERQNATIEGAIHNLPLPEGVITETIEGNGVHPIVELSSNADLLVVGNLGHGAIRDMFTGSYSEELVNKVHCPIVVIREDTRI